MKSRTDLINPADFKYMEQNPYGDPDFDSEHNKRVIAETIKATDANIRKKEREHDEAIMERASAARRYLRSITQGSGSNNVEKYFGRHELARLRGKEVLDRLKDGLTIVDKDGKVIRKPGYDKPWKTIKR